MNSEIRKILNANRAQKIFYTHTSMIAPKGTFSFPHDGLDNFWETYCNVIFKDKNAIVGINEVTQQFMPIIVDVDIKIDISKLSEFKLPHIDDVNKLGTEGNSGHIYSDEQLRQTVKTYQTTLKKTVRDITEKDLMCVVLEKPTYIKQYNKAKFFSSGFHLHFPRIFLDKKDIQIFVLPMIQCCLDELKIFDNIMPGKSSKVIDTGVFTNPWLMYGSRKAIDMQPYRVSKIFNHETLTIPLATAFGDYEIFDQQNKQIKFTKDISYYLPRILSIFTYNRKIMSISPSYKVPIFVSKRERPERKKKKEYEEIEFSETIAIISKLLPILDPARADDYNEWIRIGWIIYNATDGADEGRELWKTFSENSDKYNEIKCDYYWDTMTTGGLSIGTLKWLAKLDNPKKYQDIMRIGAKTEIKKNLHTGAHYDIAMILHKLYGDEYVCASIGKQVWYRFKDNYWKEIELGCCLRNKISTEILSIIEEIKREEQKKINETDDDIKKAMHEKRIQHIEKLQLKLKDSPYKDNIMKEVRYLCKKDDFLDRLNANPNLIPFKNGVYDFIRNEFRASRPEDYFSKTLPVNYNKDLTLTDKSVEAVLNYFKQVFPDEELRNYFLDRTSEKLAGGNKRKEFYMWVGNGDNAKTVTQKLIEKMLGPFSIKLPTTLITGKKPNVGAAFPEIARLVGVRDATMDEPDPHEKINSGTLKILTGNDSLIGRDLYESGKQMREISPMFKLNFICNALPYFESMDRATCNRIRVIPFESTFVDPDDAPETEEEQIKLKIFPKDNNFESKIPGMLEALAWYLIYHRIHFMKDFMPEKVRAATQEYKNNNDFVGQFIAENFISEDSGMITLDEIYPAFKTWYRENMDGKVPTKKKLMEDVTKIWGDPINPGCRWKGYKQYTLEDQIKNQDIVILPLLSKE